VISRKRENYAGALATSHFSRVTSHCQRVDWLDFSPVLRLNGLMAQNKMTFRTPSYNRDRTWIMNLSFKQRIMCLLFGRICVVSYDDANPREKEVVMLCMRRDRGINPRAVPTVIKAAAPRFNLASPSQS
jgi:hypothetical protein